MSAVPDQLVSREYSDRPGPSEPWRYACPACGSVSVVMNLGSGNGSLRKPRTDGPAFGNAAQTQPAPDCRCSACGHGFEERKLVDKKEEQP